MSFTGHAKLAGIMGWPVGHSRSPALHNFWLEENGIDGVYVPLGVRPERFEQALRGLPALGFRGCNLTIPHKQAALAIVDRVEPVARRIGAINTIVVAEDGSIEGRNTDAYGFREHLRESAPGWNPAAGPAVVLGAGGAARAVVAALIGAGVAEIRLVNRTRTHAEILAGDLQDGSARLSVLDWDGRSRALREAGVLVNTTSLGMDGQPTLDVDLGGLPPEAVVVDIVYVPLETGLLAAARRRGHVAVEGLGMLLHQGRPGFEAWFGAPVRVTPALRAALLATLAPPR
jgi:shikimate dehydrogenase